MDIRHCFSVRLIILAALFAGICLFYSGKLFFLQGGKLPDFSIYQKGRNSQGSTTQVVAIQAMRGEIYDRNGKPLVTNLYSYDLNINYDAFMQSGSNDVRNETLLSVLRTLDHANEGGASSAYLPTDAFPLVGVYPRLSYCPEVVDSNSKIAYQLSRVLSYIGMSGNTDATALTAYYVQRYGLGAQIDGIPRYTAEEITRLIRVYYDMDRQNFSTLIPYTMVKNVNTAFITEQKEAGRAGIEFTIHAERVYHYAGIASHILGRVSQISAEDLPYYNAKGYPMDAVIGIIGCESIYESLLRGTDGEMTITYDADGKVIDRQVTKEAIAGQDIWLTIDIEVQEAIERAYPAGTRGALVMMDAKSGEILAMVSAPTYKVEDYSKDVLNDPAQPLLNRALSAAYRAGECLYPMVAAGISGENILLVPGYKDALLAGDGDFFEGIVQAAGKDTADVVFSQFGIGHETGIALSEVIGNADGLESRCTPMQLCSMISVILNGGVRYEARLLKEVRSFISGDITRRESSVIIEQNGISEEVYRFIARCMEESAQIREKAIYEELAENGISFGLYGGMIDQGKGNINEIIISYGEYKGDTNSHLIVSMGVMEGKENEGKIKEIIKEGLLKAGIE